MTITVTVNLEAPDGTITKYGTITSPHNVWIRPTLRDVDQDGVYRERRLVAVSAVALLGLVRWHAVALGDDYPDEVLPTPPDLFGEDWEDREDGVMFALIGSRVAADTFSLDIDSIVPLSDAPGFAGHRIVLGVDIQNEPEP